MKLKSQILLLHIFAFCSVFIFGLTALAQSGTVPDGELEIAINGMVDAFKIGQMGAIIMALIQLLKTRVVTGFLLFVAAKVGFKVPQTPKPAEIPVEEMTPEQLKEAGYEEMEMIEVPKAEPPKLPATAVVGANVLLGAAAGVAQSMATGIPAKDAIFQGLLSSGVATALWEMVAKPLVKKFTKK